MSFSAEKVKIVWEKGIIVPEHNSNEWRKDQCKAWINRGSYGKTDTIYGWEVDHITPKAKGGSDNLSNLRPLQWDNNREKDAGKSNCVVTSQGNKNIRINRNRKAQPPR